MAAYRDPKHFFDRELSWLAFNRRVLEEGQDKTVPLLDRLKFLGIVTNNMDEFFMVRVSGVQEQIISNVRVMSQAGYTPAMQYALIHQEAHKQFELLYRCYRNELLPQLEQNKISITSTKQLSSKMRKTLKTKFEKEVFPCLTPLAVDAAHPFPRLKGLSLNIIVELEATQKQKRSNNEPLIAIVQVPSMLPRLLEINSLRDVRRFILLEEFIQDHLGSLFPGMKVRSSAAFRITRDADIEYKEIESDDLLKHIESEIRERERGMAVRMEIDDDASELHVQFLSSVLKLTPQQIYFVKGPLAMNEISGPILKIEGKEHLKEAPFTPNLRKRLQRPGSIFSKIQSGDILLHHPYESFIPVVDFIREAAADPNVLAIKQTLYRTSGDSPIIKSLIQAAENGKQVAALVELKARFDEENNIVWARQLEEAGVHVVYGLVGLKTHCKISMVVREEKGEISRYVHLSTGNYNPSTAKLYTDAGLFTCDPAICDDATQLFNLLTGYADSPQWQRLVIAPEDLRPTTMKLINEQRELAESGKPARIRAKMNSLVDTEIIVELYRASRAGVKIELNIRGVCCLRPGIKGISENIRVWSIVDRFLEHSRVFIFGADDKTAKVYMSSADWMDRNMDRRVEVMFPILNIEVKKRVIGEIYGASARGNVKARHLGIDGIYRKIRRKAGSKAFRSQAELMKLESTSNDKDAWAFNLSEEKVAEQLASTVALSPSRTTRGHSPSTKTKAPASRVKVTKPKVPVGRVDPESAELTKAAEDSQDQLK